VRTTLAVTFTLAITKWVVAAVNSLFKLPPRVAATVSSLALAFLSSEEDASSSGLKETCKALLLDPNVTTLPL